MSEAVGCYLSEHILGRADDASAVTLQMQMSWRSDVHGALHPSNTIIPAALRP